MYIHPDIKAHFSASEPCFDELMQLRGETYRELENRRTQRVILNAQPYFIKQHFGVGWKEIFKNLCQLRLPVVSAKNEWQAIHRLQKLSIPTLDIVGYGSRGCNPARRESFLMTRELPPFVTLEELSKEWQSKRPAWRFKQALIQEVARIARVLHEEGINHRDFYLCHFLMDTLKYSLEQPHLYLIDLHRAQIRSVTPTRWAIKDLAGLYFSSKDSGLTQRDLWRFIRAYRGSSLRNVFNKEAAFWLKVKTRGDKLYRKHES